MNTQSRQTLRQHYRHYRRSLSSEQQKIASQDIIQTAFAHDMFTRARKVACYLANDGELDLTPFIKALWKGGVNVYLPVLHPFTKGHLLFIQYREDTPMINNRFGIPEPALNIQHIGKPDELDCLFVPLVAFDEAGNRLGMGGGFYDRTLAPVTRSKTGGKPQLIGVAHEGQLAKQLPYQGWDIPMPYILTPERLINTTQ